MQRTHDDKHLRGPHLAGPNAALAVFGLGLCLVAIAIVWQGAQFGSVDWTGIVRSALGFLICAGAIAVLGIQELRRERQLRRMDEAVTELRAASSQADDAERRMRDRKTRRSA